MSGGGADPISLARSLLASSGVVLNGGQPFGCASWTRGVFSAILERSSSKGRHVADRRRRPRRPERVLRVVVDRARGAAAARPELEPPAPPPAARPGARPGRGVSVSGVRRRPAPDRPERARRSGLAEGADRQAAPPPPPDHRAPAAAAWPQEDPRSARPRPRTTSSSCSASRWIASRRSGPTRSCSPVAPGASIRRAAG